MSGPIDRTPTHNDDVKAAHVFAGHFALSAKAMRHVSDLLDANGGDFTELRPNVERIRALRQAIDALLDGLKYTHQVVCFIDDANQRDLEAMRSG